MNKQKKFNKDGSIKSRGIEWTDRTWNVTGGCFHACQWTMPDGVIANCYAEDVAERLAGEAYPQGFEHHYWHPKRLQEPLRVKEPQKIFVGSMADVFGHWVKDEEIQSILDVCASASWHTFQFLSKNISRAKDFKLPKNVWLGTSTPPTFMWGARLTHHQQLRLMGRALKSLWETDAAVRWISAEPLAFDLAPLLRDYPGAIDWIVIGAASNGSTYYAPEQRYFDALMEEAARQEIAVFFKGNLKVLPAAQTAWREEFPAVQP